MPLSFTVHYEDNSHQTRQLDNLLTNDELKKIIGCDELDSYYLSSTGGRIYCEKNSHLILTKKQNRIATILSEKSISGKAVTVQKAYEEKRILERKRRLEEFRHQQKPIDQKCRLEEFRHQIIKQKLL